MDDTSLGPIRVGIGGWTYAPWRETFYPQGLRQADERSYAIAQMGAIEINATFYGRQKPGSWAAWAKDLPPEFRFSLKGSRYVASRKALADAGEGIAQFVAQGFTALGPNLGPILWQLRESRVFDPDDIAAFIALLPDVQDGVALRHVIEARHESFTDPRFAELCHARGVGTVFANSLDYPCIDHSDGAPFIYARLQNARSEEPAGYDAAEIDAWADRARGWATGGREVFVFMINGAKERAPAAALALQAALAKKARRATGEG